MSLKLEIFYGNPPFDSVLTIARSVAAELGNLEITATNAADTTKQEREENIKVHRYPMIRLYRDSVMIAWSDVIFWSKVRLQGWITANAMNPEWVSPQPSGQPWPVFQELLFTHQVRSQVRRHGFVVLPRDAYGFLLAAVDFRHVVACLPVGETKGLGDWQTRFSMVDEARPVADRFAAEYGLVVAGLYVTDYDGCAAPPMLGDIFGSRIRADQQFPENYLNSFLLYRWFAGGETMWGDQVVVWRDKTGWTDLRIIRSVAKPLRQLWNQRRIYRCWRRRWHGSEYMNHGYMMFQWNKA